MYIDVEIKGECSNMDEQESKLEEYKMLREEIQNCVERDNSLVTFMVTAVSTILTFAISANLQVPFLFLISFCIIIPFTGRISHYKTNVARISSYLIVFLEPEMDIKYETRNSMVKSAKSKISKLLVAMRNYVGLLLGILSYAIYLVEYNNKIGFSNWWDWVFSILPIFFLILIFLMDKKIDSVPQEKAKWIENWKQLKETK